MCQGIRFDPDLPQTLRLEFAKTNTKVVKPKQQLAQLAVAAAAAAASHTPYMQPIAGRKYMHLSSASPSLQQFHITSLPKVIWEHGRVAAAVPGAGWHKGLRIRNVCIVILKDRCANVQYFSVRKQE